MRIPLEIIKKVRQVFLTDLFSLPGKGHYVPLIVYE